MTTGEEKVIYLLNQSRNKEEAIKVALLLLERLRANPDKPPVPPEAISGACQ